MTASGAGSTTASGAGTGGSGSCVTVGSGGSGTTGGTGGNGGTGADGGCAGATSGFPTRTLTQVLTGAPWGYFEGTTGMAVDAQGTVYLTDQRTQYSRVFAVHGTAVDVYLTSSDMSCTTPASHFYDVDWGPDGALYIITDGAILRSGAPHHASAFRTLSLALGPYHMGVVSPNLIAVVPRLGGLWRVEPTGDTQLYAAGKFPAGSGGCATEDLAVAASGVFVYQPGCNGSPIVRGNVDGSGVAVLLGSSPVQPNALGDQNFLCSGRDPVGGFYTIIQDASSNLPRLVHFDECFTDTTGFVDVPLNPSFAAAHPPGTLAFSYCSLAVSPAGTIFIQTVDQLWRVDP
jgi:hypothetical protein